MFLMAESQIEKQKETEVKKEHNNLVKVLGITREDTESEHCYYKPSQSQGGDSMAINGRRRTTTKAGDDDIIKVGIRINNKYASLVPELTREEYESLRVHKTRWVMGSINSKSRWYIIGRTP
jgi:hypothetical protein